MSELHPAGSYTASVMEHGISRSKSNTVQVAIKFKTEHGTITGWFPLSDKAAKHTIEKLKNIGFTGDSVAQVNDGVCLIGKECVITVGHDEYQGKRHAKVSYVNPPGYEGQEIRRDDDAAREASAYDVLLRSGTPSAPRGQLCKTPASDEVPF